MMDAIFFIQKNTNPKNKVKVIVGNTMAYTSCMAFKKNTTAVISVVYVFNVLFQLFYVRVFIFPVYPSACQPSSFQKASRDFIRFDIHVTTFKSNTNFFFMRKPLNFFNDK